MRLICILLLFYGLSFSATNETKNYQEALSLYEQQRYQESYDAFKKLFFENLDNEKINYYLAKSAIEIKNYDMALAAFERILINNPKNYRVQFEEAKLIYLLGKEKVALEALYKLQNMQLEPSLVADINAFIEFIKDNQKLLSFNTTLILSLNYLDNANSAPTSQYTLPNFDYLGTQGASERSDFNHYEYINFNILKQLRDHSSVSIKNGFSYYTKTFRDEKEENFELFSYKPGIQVTTNKYRYYVGTLFERYHPGNTSENYFDSAGLEVIYFDKNQKIDLIGQRYFYQREDKKDKNYTRYGFSYKYYNLNNFNISASFNKYLAFHSNRTDLNKIAFDTTLSYNYTIDESWKLIPSVTYKMLNYKDESVAFGTRRQDRKNELSLLLQRKLDRSSFINLQTTYEDNYSNHAEYDYKNYSVGLMYLKQFSW